MPDWNYNVSQAALEKTNWDTANVYCLMTIDELYGIRKTLLLLNTQFSSQTKPIRPEKFYKSKLLLKLFGTKKQNYVKQLESSAESI